MGRRRDRAGTIPHGRKDREPLRIDPDDHSKESQPCILLQRERRAKALTGLVVAAGLTLAADPPGPPAASGEGESMKHIFSQKLPNVPGKTLTVVEVDYRPGGFSAPHRHPASGFVFAYVLSGTIRSQVEGEPLGVYTHLCETMDEERYTLEKYGLRPVAWMGSLVWLNRDVWCAHAIHVNDDEIREIPPPGLCLRHR